MELKSKLDFTEIPSIPQLIKDFLNVKFEQFQEDRFSLENFTAKIAAKSESFSKSKRENLVAVLSSQLNTIPLSESQQNNLQFLAETNTFTVTTGHQLNLFSGPVFFVYKILQTIKTADYLSKKFPNHHFVPVFWMATEDHDFDEINHFSTDKNYYEFNAQSGGAVGKIVIEDQNFFSGFEEEFKDEVFGTELILLLKKSFKKGVTLASATRELVNELFSAYGLIIIDGDEKSLKAEMKEVFSDELLEQSLYHSSKTAIDHLTDLYGKVQVNPREINLFYLTDTRDRIEFDGSKYQIVDKNITFTTEEIMSELENFPEKFSPNAVMRPVFQETVLPNIAYIGGNAEIMYWLELKDYFAKIDVPFPILIPRNSMLWLPEKTFRKLDKLNLNIKEYFQDFSLLIKDQFLNNNKILAEITSAKNVLVQQFADLKMEAGKTDITFHNLVEAEETRQLKSFGRMEKRLLRAEKIKEKELLERLENLFLEIHPGKTWQERIYNFSVFYRELGADFIKESYAAMDIEKSELIILQI